MNKPYAIRRTRMYSDDYTFKEIDKIFDSCNDTYVYFM